MLVPGSLKKAANSTSVGLGEGDRGGDPDDSDRVRTDEGGDMMSGGEAGLSIKVNAGVVSRDFLTKVGVVSRGGDLTGSSQTMLEEDA